MPRSERFKQENVLLVGVIPLFKHEPSSLNSYLGPLVDELKDFWQSAVRLYTSASPNYKLLFRVALMCVACDIPAARKCVVSRDTLLIMDVLAVQNIFLVQLVRRVIYSGFDMSLWIPRNYASHMDTIRKILACNTQSSINALETEGGVKYSVLTELPYFDPIRFTVIDPMIIFSWVSRRP